MFKDGASDAVVEGSELPGSLLTGGRAVGRAVTRDNQTVLLLFEGAAVLNQRNQLALKPWALKATCGIGGSCRGSGNQRERAVGFLVLESGEREDSRLSELLPFWLVIIEIGEASAYFMQVEADQINWEQRLAGTRPVRSRESAS